MKRKIGEKVTVLGINGIIKYINNDLAWICPLEDSDESYNGHLLRKGLAFEVMDETGKINGGPGINRNSRLKSKI